MRYVMKARLLSWGDDFVIRDASGAESFIVDGKAFTLGKKLSFQDLRGNELLFIRQRLLSLGPTYQIEQQGHVVAVVHKHLFTFFGCRFTVDVEGPDDLEAKGDFLHHEYEFTRHSRSVARVSKQWFAFTDTYGVDVDEGEDDLLVLAATVVIDMACHDDD